MTAHQDDPGVIQEKKIDNIVFRDSYVGRQGREPENNISYKDYHLKCGP